MAQVLLFLKHPKLILTFIYGKATDTELTSDYDTGVNWREALTPDSFLILPLPTERPKVNSFEPCLDKQR